MSRAKRDEVHAHPADSIDIACALVAGVQRRRAIPIIDVPYVQEAVIGVAQGREILRVGAESDAFDTESVVAEGGEGNIGGCFFGG